MKMKRNSFIILLKVYELLLQKPQTFYSLRSKVKVGYHPLRKLMDRMVADGLAERINKNGKEYFKGTKMLFELFSGSFYDGLRKLSETD